MSVFFMHGSQRFSILLTTLESEMQTDPSNTMVTLIQGAKIGILRGVSDFPLSAGTDTASGAGTMDGIWSFHGEWVPLCPR